MRRDGRAVELELGRRERRGRRPILWEPQRLLRRSGSSLTFFHDESRMLGSTPGSGFLERPEKREDQEKRG